MPAKGHGKLGHLGPLIAQRRAEGKSLSAIAEEIGCSKRTLQNHKAEIDFCIAQVMRPHHQALARLVPKAIAVVSEAMQSGEETVNRLRAVKTLGYVMELAEGRRSDDGTMPPQRYAGTLEEALILYRRLVAPGPPDPPE